MESQAKRIALLINTCAFNFHSLSRWFLLDPILDVVLELLADLKTDIGVIAIHCRYNPSYLHKQRCKKLQQSKKRIDI